MTRVSDFPSSQQINPQGRLWHLLTLQGLPRAVLERLLDHAEVWRDRWFSGERRVDLLAGRSIVNLFFESSTRTRTSFELAAKRLGADVINFEITSSSTSKGETLFDTVRTLEAMQCDALVVRHQESGTPQRIVQHLQSACRVLNAGDGHHAHPTQGLLDVFTIRRYHPNFSDLRVVICGDIKHSRVARSDIHALQTLGIGELRLCGPNALLPDATEFSNCEFFENFDNAITDADIVIMLRLQKERMEAALIPSEQDYFCRYGLDQRRINLAKPTCKVMHPGPINREVEIASDVADGGQSLILEQVLNGVFIRMAVLAELLS